jgi:NADP-dependent 3-hydroxy acid dehydrogenase YdfG
MPEHSTAARVSKEWGMIARGMQHKTAFITGASSGIGAEVARRLAAKGIEVGLGARRHDALEAVADAIRSAGGRARVYPLDVADPEQTTAVVQRADDELGGLDTDAGAAS